MRYDKNRIACIIFTIGVMQFLLLTSVAAFTYPGDYNYIRYFFSDLGTIVARNGETNSISSKLFFIALTTYAITSIPFWLVTKAMFKESGKERYLSKFGSALGLASTPFMMGIALLPFDTQLTAHIIVAFFFILLHGGGSLLYSIAILLNQRYPKSLGIMGSVLFLTVLLTFVVSLMTHLAPIGAFLQKIVFYGYSIWEFSHIFYVWN